MEDEKFKKEIIKRLDINPVNTAQKIMFYFACIAIVFLICVTICFVNKQNIDYQTSLMKEQYKLNNHRR